MKHKNKYSIWINEFLCKCFDRRRTLQAQTDVKQSSAWSKWQHLSPRIMLKRRKPLFSSTQRIQRQYHTHLVKKCQCQAKFSIIQSLRKENLAQMFMNIVSLTRSDEDVKPPLLYTPGRGRPILILDINKAKYFYKIPRVSSFVLSNYFFAISQNQL